MSLTIISPAFYPDTKRCEMLIESCKMFGLRLHMYGIGEEFTSYFDTKVNRLLPEVSDIDSEYVLLTDAHDSFFLSDEKEIMEKYYKFNTPILVSADIQEEIGDSRYPQNIFRDTYPKSNTPWRYCNSGGYIGTKDALVKLLRRMATIEWKDCYRFIPIYRWSDWHNDQFIMSMVYISGYDDIKIDTHCEVFQTMNLSSKEQFKQSRRLTNIVTGTQPCIAHFNAGWPGIRPMFEERFKEELVSG